MGRTLLNIPTKNSNELSKKKPKLKPLLPTPFRPVDTTTTCSENNTKKNKKLRPNFSDPCPRPTPKSPPGGLNTRPMPSSELKNSKKLAAKLQEVEELVESTQAKCASLEKTKVRQL